MDARVEKGIFDRLQRMESRLVRGFTELGAIVCDDDEWIRIDLVKMEVHMKGSGRSFKAVLMALRNAGAGTGSYRMLANKEVLGTIWVP
jgi:hypothetical protein